MALLFTRGEQEDMLKPMWIGETALKNRRSVLRAFEGLSQRIIAERPTSFGDDSIFAATEWLLHACAKGEIDWKTLATLIEHRANYTAVFCHLGGEPMDYGKGFENARAKKWWKRTHCRDSYVRHLAKRAMTGDFIGTIKWLVDYLRSKNMKTGGASKRDVLSGRSPEHLLHLWDYGRYDAGGRPQEDKDRQRSGARVYEAELLADREFVSELDAIAKAVCAKHNRWCFRLYGDYEWTFDKLPDPGKRTDISERRPQFRLGDLGADLPSFCRKWCVHEVSVSGLGYNSGRGVRFEVQRVRIARTETGVEAFIPRYYKLNDIRYRSTDFAPLKQALDESYGRLSLRKSRRAKVEEAKRFRKALIDQGTPRHKAWDDTMAWMEWTPDTMEHYLGVRPAEKDIDHACPSRSRNPR